MEPTFKVDTSQVRLAFRAYKVATKKDEVDIINRACRNIAFRAAQFTPKGDANRIKRDLMRDQNLRYALTSLALRKRGIGRLVTPEFQKAVDRFVARRASSANYLRAGWAKAIQDFGGIFKGAKFRGAGGFGNKSITAHLIADIVNETNHDTLAEVQGAELIGTQAVKLAVADVAEDMLKFAKETMGYTAKKFSG